MPSEPTDESVSLATLHALAADMLVEVEDGAALDDREEALVALGVAAAVTSLDVHAIDARIGACFAAGASVAQAQEVVSLVSGLGVHSLMTTATRIVAQAKAAGLFPAGDLTAEQERLWARHVGDDPFWAGFERHHPGFLDAMLRLSPGQFSTFFDYCAVPWTGGAVFGRLKELIAMASDATPAHRFLPGFSFHLANALRLGAGRSAVSRCLAIAAEAPPHVGTR